MLSLTRNDGEWIEIQCGETSIRVQLVRSMRGRAVIGIEAPPEVKINREPK